MPYKIVEEHKGCFGIKDVKHPKYEFSKKCQTKKQAEKQRIAIALSESRKSGKPIKNYFV